MIIAHLLRQCPRALEPYRQRAIQEDGRSRNQHARKLRQQLHAKYPKQSSSPEERQARIAYLITLHNYESGAERQTTQMLT